MHNYFVVILLNFSIIIPVVIAIKRFRRLHKSYYPFIVCIFFGLVNEILSLSLIYRYGSNHVNSNIYVLIEFGIILFQFYTWNKAGAGKYLWAAGIGLLVWITDNFFIHAISDNNSLYRVAYSVIIVLCSIDQINKLLIFERGRLLKNAMFLICIGFFLSYSCKAFVETFNLFDPLFSNPFLWNLWFILYLVNCISNLIYAFAVTCIQTRQEFTLPF
jgi:hypothetical protein